MAKTLKPGQTASVSGQYKTFRFTWCQSEGRGYRHKGRANAAYAETRDELPTG